MKKLMIIVAALVFICMPLNSFAASKVITYDFESIEVLEAMKVTAVPTNTSLNQTPNGNSSVKKSVYEAVYQSVYNHSTNNINFTQPVSNWITNVSGQKNMPIEILYGAIKLNNKGGSFINEEFIKITGMNNSERFLSNSKSFEYYDGTNKLKKTKTLFWSFKQLVGTQVIKGGVDTIKSVILYREYDLNGNITNIYLTFPEEDSLGKSAINYYDSNIMQNVYIGDLTSLRQGNSKGGINE